MRKGKWLLLALLPVAGIAPAHFEKPLDLNGGHYGPGGDYHCHDDFGCRRTEARWERRRGLIRNVEDYEIFYLKEDWPHWELINGCQDARHAVLAATSREPVTFSNPRNCIVREGLWIDQYTGEEYRRAGELEIDHIIPPQYAHGTNGYQWDDGKRMAFANDPQNLIPVARDTYRKKRQRSIDRWQPRDEFQCEYARSWRDVSEKYELDLVARDTSRIERILEECGDVETTDARD